MTQQHYVVLLIKDDQYEFFGSPSSFYDKYSSKNLGMTRESQSNYFHLLKEDETPVFRNSICEIRKDEVLVKPSTR